MSFQAQQFVKEMLDYLRHYYFTHTDKIMYIETLKSELQEQKTKKIPMSQYQRYKTEPGVESQKNNYRNQLKKDNRCQSFVFNLTVKKADNVPIIHKKSQTQFKKYMFSHNKTQMKDHRGCTPYQERKLNEKIQSKSKQSRNRKQKSNESKLQIFQGRLMKLSEMLSPQKKSDENLDKSNIRQTQTSAKEDNLLTFTQQSQLQAASQKISNSLTLDQQKRNCSLNEKMKFKNIKVTFKQLLRAQKCPGFQKTIKKSVESDLMKSINITAHQYGKQQNSQLRKSKTKQFFDEQVNNSKLKKSKSKIKSHIRHSKSSSGYIQNFISSVISIKPSNLQQKAVNFSNQQLNSRLSCKKSLINVSKIDFNSRSGHQRKKQVPRREKTQVFKSQPKEFSGWEYPNDFSERQTFF